MKDYIFLSGNSPDNLPESGLADDEMEQCQVLGFSSGENPSEAFRRLATANKDVLKKALSDIFSYELRGENWTNRSIIDYK